LQQQAGSAATAAAGAAASRELFLSQSNKMHPIKLGGITCNRLLMQAYVAGAGVRFC
jgi:hypothetical protein